MIFTIKIHQFFCPDLIKYRIKAQEVTKNKKIRNHFHRSRWVKNWIFHFVSFWTPEINFFLVTDETAMMEIQSGKQKTNQWVVNYYSSSNIMIDIISIDNFCKLLKIYSSLERCQSQNVHQNWANSKHDRWVEYFCSGISIFKGLEFLESLASS